MQAWCEISCPYCGERIDIVVDAGAGGQQYVEDCQVCCRPIALTVLLDNADDEPRVIARRDDEA